MIRLSEPMETLILKLLGNRVETFYKDNIGYFLVYNEGNYEGLEGGRQKTTFRTVK